MPWQYMKDGEIQGPLGDLEFDALRAEIAPETKVYKEGWKEWRRLGDVPASEFPQKPLPEPVDESAEKPASISRRAGAWILDFLIIRAAVTSLGQGGSFWWAPGSFSWSLSDSSWSDWVGLATLATVVYETAMIHRLGWTLGKFVFGIKVLHEGRLLTWQRSLARVILKKLNWATMMIGYAVAFFDKDTKALHDHLCKTRVFLR